MFWEDFFSGFRVSSLLLLLFALLVLDLAGRLMYYTPARLPLRSGQRERLGLAVFWGTRGQVHPPQEACHNTARLDCSWHITSIKAEVGGTYLIRPVDSSTFRSEG